MRLLFLFGVAVMATSCAAMPEIGAALEEAATAGAAAGAEEALKQLEGVKQGGSWEPEAIAENGLWAAIAVTAGNLIRNRARKARGEAV